MFKYKVKDVLSVYDGDTITVLLDIGFGIYSTQTLRFFGINAPEMKGDDKKIGTDSRDWLREQIANAMSPTGPGLMVETFKDKKEKYGRLLAKLFIVGDERSLNESLVHNGLAIPYMDGLKDQ